MRGVRHRLQRGAHQVRAGGPAGEPHDGAPRLGLPVRRPQPREGGDEVDAVVPLYRAGQEVGFGGVLHDAQPVAQPLHSGAGDEDGAFQREGPLAARPAGGGGEQPVLRAHRLVAGVHQQEGAGAVGVLPLARRPAAVPEERGLLVARDAGHGHLRLQRVAGGVAVHLRRGAHLREHRRRHAEQVEQRRVPAPRPQVVQQRARRIGGVGEVQAAAGELPHQPRVHGAGGQLARLGAAARAGDVVQQPGQLGGAEVRVDHQPRPLAHGVFVPRGLQGPARLGGAAVLPDERAVDGAPRGAVPHHDRFSLVGDADPGQRLHLQPRVRDRHAGDAPGHVPDLLGVVLHQAGAGEVLRELAVRPSADLAVPVDDQAGDAGGAFVDRQDHGRVVVQGGWGRGLLLGLRIRIRIR